MKLIGYARTDMAEDLGEQDLEEQERGLAEFCSQNCHELSAVFSDEKMQAAGLERALSSQAEGIIVTDPLVFAQDLASVYDFSSRLARHKKHLFIIYRNQHIDPHKQNIQDELLNLCQPLIDCRGDGKHKFS